MLSTRLGTKKSTKMNKRLKYMLGKPTLISIASFNCVESSQLLNVCNVDGNYQLKLQTALICSINTLSKAI